MYMVPAAGILNLGLSVPVVYRKLKLKQTINANAGHIPNWNIYSLLLSSR